MARALPLFYAIQEIADALEERQSAPLAKAELTASQFNLLYLVIEEGPMRLGEVARYRRCVKSNASNLTRAMEKEGLVTLNADPSDRRARVVEATKEGVRRYRVACRAFARIERSLRTALGAKVTDELERLCLVGAAAVDELG
ncbi:MAG: MarR family transcriptional regulator [Myxococcota bacterium]